MRQFKVPIGLLAERDIALVDVGPFWGYPNIATTSQRESSKKNPSVRKALGYGGRMAPRSIGSSQFDQNNASANWREISKLSELVSSRNLGAWGRFVCWEAN